MVYTDLFCISCGLQNRKGEGEGGKDKRKKKLYAYLWFQQKYELPKHTKFKFIYQVLLKFYFLHPLSNNQSMWRKM